METHHCIGVRSLSRLWLCHDNSQMFAKTQAEPGYLCTLESRRRTQTPTTRKGNTWVHLRSPRWAMLSWYFTWKDRIGDCLGTRVNICACCQNKNRRAHKQNKGYMGAMPGGLNREMRMCTHTHTHTCSAPLLHISFLSLGRPMAWGTPVLQPLLKNLSKTRNPSWAPALLGSLRNPPTEEPRATSRLKEGWGSVAWLVSTPLSAWPR